MARPRKFEDDAARQKAHRARRKSEVVEIDRAALNALTARLERLHAAVADAAAQGDELALEARAGSVDTMLDNLVKAFECRASEGSK